MNSQYSAEFKSIGERPGFLARAALNVRKYDLSLILIEEANLSLQ